MGLSFVRLHERIGCIESAAAKTAPRPRERHTELDIEALAFARTDAGFVTTMHERVACTGPLTHRRVPDSAKKVAGLAIGPPIAEPLVAMRIRFNDRHTRPNF